MQDKPEFDLYCPAALRYCYHRRSNEVDVARGSEATKSSLDVGLLGELLVQQKLVEHGWHPICLDARRAAANADIIAIRNQYRCTLQVKSTEGDRAHSHSDCIHLGHAGAHLRSNAPFFNSKQGLLVADIVVGVNYNRAGSRFFILPVAVAEFLCREHAKYWSQVVTKRGQRRNHQFPVYLAISEGRRAHSDFHSRTVNNLSTFEERWELLNAPTSKLHNLADWKVS